MRRRRMSGAERTIIRIPDGRNMESPDPHLLPLRQIKKKIIIRRIYLIERVKCRKKTDNIR